MNFFRNFFALLLAAIVLLTSCQEDNSDELIVIDSDYKIDTIVVNPLLVELRGATQDYLGLECLKIPYPLELLQQSGATITIFTEADLDSATMLSDSIVDFVYPFVVETQNGQVQINQIEDLVLELSSCSVEPPSDCLDLEAHVLLFYNGLNIFTLNKYEYEINYPVSLLVEGSSITINSDEEYLPAIGNDPFKPLPTELVYPITVTQFGQDIILSSDADVCQLYASLSEPCENKPAHIQFFFNEGSGTPVNCAYFIEYPVFVALNSTADTIMSIAEYNNLLSSNQNAYSDLELIYPVQAFRYKDGQMVVFDSDESICEYLNTCN